MERRERGGGEKKVRKWVIRVGLMIAAGCGADKRRICLNVHQKGRPLGGWECEFTLLPKGAHVGIIGRDNRVLEIRHFL